MPGFKHGEVKIACITLAHDNKEILNLLRTRGTVCTKGDFAKLQLLEEHIVKRVQGDFQKLRRPVMAFVTFCSQEAAVRCLRNFRSRENFFHQPKYGEQHLQLFDQKVPCLPGQEVENIIWENLPTQGVQIFKNKVKTNTAIALLLICILWTFVFLKGSATQSLMAYPPQVDCQGLKKMLRSKNKFKLFAEIDKEPTSRRKGTGVYQCYCERYSSAKVLLDLDPTAFCWDYHFAVGRIQVFANTITVAIAVINLLARYFNIYLIKGVGYNTESFQMAQIMQSILYATFFNTAILIVLCNANFKQYPWLKWFPLRGQFHDTSSNWYILVGPPLVQTMMVLAIFP